MLAEISDFIWTNILVIALVFCGILFTVMTRFVQFRLFGEMFRLLGESAFHGKKGKKAKQINSFQAFAVSLASRVGTGNLAGVATAIFMGGPGAVFWMWLIALLGSATAFIESTLAQLYKRQSTDSFIGGPAYYILHGLHNKRMAQVFAVLLILSFGLSNNSIQSNSICDAMDEAFGLSSGFVGIILTCLSLLIVFGGIQRVAKVSSVIVPIMATGYFLLAMYVIIMNLDLIPGVFRIIVSDAFGFDQVAGGTIGSTIIYGIKRGLFSNEAGEGSAPNVAATASVSHPVKQGLIQALGVFTDTILVCSCTAFIILVSGMYTSKSYNGIRLTQNALEAQVGPIGTYFVAIAILLFAFSSIIGNYYYGESNVRFLSKKKSVLTIYRILSGGVMVMFGALASLDLVWNLGDIFMALLTGCNLIAIVLLAPKAIKLLKDYTSQKKEGKNPTFVISSMPEIEKDVECW